MRRQIAICIAVAAMLLTACGAEAKEKKVADEAELVDIATDETGATEPETGATTEDGQESGNADEAEETVEIDAAEETEKPEAEEQTKAEVKEQKAAQDASDAKEPSITKKETVTKPAAQPSNPDAGCVDDASDILTY